jgi:hypothetical protein
MDSLAKQVDSWIFIFYVAVGIPLLIGEIIAEIYEKLERTLLNIIEH